APEPEAEPEPTRFKVFDVLGARELARDIDVAAVVHLLEPRTSVLDSRVYVWLPGADRWRLLTLAEHKLLWSYRGRV
ncbi:MAG TPA: hypothetical protein VNZ05_02410, partial [Solirubrobacteraceae bacterium]|nr:hypothetical protein [Solirubrobacteraceae bacterium]